jgi:hypothetical protein
MPGDADIMAKFCNITEFLAQYPATLGLMLYSDYAKNLSIKIFGATGLVRKIMPVDDFSNSVACLILVWPIIAHFFGRVSILSPLYNMAVLWLIPLCTIAGFVYLFVAIVLPDLSWIVAWPISLLYRAFEWGVTNLASVDVGSIDFKISGTLLFLYYLLLLLMQLKSQNKNN